jgi:hypothetical protein
MYYRYKCIDLYNLSYNNYNNTHDRDTTGHDNILSVDKTIKYFVIKLKVRKFVLLLGQWYTKFIKTKSQGG